METPRLLILRNAGRMSRHWITGIERAAARLGVGTLTCEVDELRIASQANPEQVARQMARLCRRKPVGAVLGYVWNGVFDVPLQRVGGEPRSLFDAIDIPHLLFWSDHPQWAVERAPLAPEVQPVLRSPGLHHFVKSDAAAHELRQFLRWPRCHATLVAEDLDDVRPAPDVAPEFDVVVLSGTGPTLDPRWTRHLSTEDPDVDALTRLAVGDAHRAAREVMDRLAPPALHPLLARLVDDWSERRAAALDLAAVRHLDDLAPEHPEALIWLQQDPRRMFEIIRTLWIIPGWRRAFLPQFLAKHVSVGVCGADWSCVGIGGDRNWVEQDAIGAAYARGRIALTVSAGHDEEGLTHKPFQIAASAVPMLHQAQIGLSDAFEPGAEVATFRTPGEALATVRSLLADPDRRDVMATRALARVRRDHTWDVRLPQMLAAAGLDIESFRAGVQSSSAAAADANRRNAAAKAATSSDVASTR